MADTVITTPAVRDYDSGVSAMGWAVAVILLLGVIFFGIFVWPGVGSISPATDTSQGIDVNVSLPQGTSLPGTNTNNTVPTGGTQTQTQ